MFDERLAGIPGIGQVMRDVPLAPFTTWRVGGPARWWCEPDARALPQALALARRSGVPAVALGRGSNVLIADEGIDGLVISTRRSLTGLHYDGETIVAEAGVPLPTLAKAAAGLGYGGFEFLIGIPGTVGAGVAINAGLTAGEVRDVAGIVDDAEVVDLNGRVEVWDRRRLALRYRGSAVLDQHAIVLRACFVPRERSDPGAIRLRTAQHLAERRRKQPLTRPTAGSTFKQPDGGRPAGWYIDRAGLKGLRVGGARVSDKHANWIETGVGATAGDVRELIGLVQETVQAVFDVRLEREVRFLPEDMVGGGG